MVAAEKTYSDSYYENSTYAFVGGVTNRDMNLLEHEFMRMIGFELYISEESYGAYRHQMSCFAVAVSIAPVLPVKSGLRFLRHELEKEEKDQIEDMLDTTSPDPKPGL